MAKAIVLTETKINGNQQLIGVYTQVKLAWQGILDRKFQSTAVLVAPGAKDIGLTYESLASRLRRYGKVEIWSGGETHLGFVIQTELNHTRRH